MRETSTRASVLNPAAQFSLTRLFVKGSIPDAADTSEIVWSRFSDTIGNYIIVRFLAWLLQAFWSTSPVHLEIN